jgi:lysophospholipase L1-like esterase
VLLGSNDCASNPDGQTVPLDEYKDNLRFIVRHLRAASPGIHIILITPPLLDDVQWPNRPIDRVTAYAEAVRVVAAEEETHIVDLWVGDELVELCDLRDGLHLGSGGSNKVAQGIISTIRGRIPQICPEGEAMQLHFPPWRELLDVSADGSVNIPQAPEKGVALARQWSWK